MLAMVVLMARRVVTLRLILAGADLWSIQNENQDTMTIIMVGK